MYAVLVSNFAAPGNLEQAVSKPVRHPGVYPIWRHCGSKCIAPKGGPFLVLLHQSCWSTEETLGRHLAYQRANLIQLRKLFALIVLNTFFW